MIIIITDFWSYFPSVYVYHAWRRIYEEQPKPKINQIYFSLPVDSKYRAFSK